MSGLAKWLLATALTLPLVAFVAGVLAAPDQPAPDRGRPVIIGQVDDDQPGGEPARSRERNRPHDRVPDDRRAADRGPSDTDDTDDGDDRGDGDVDRDDGDAPAPQGPVTVVTPPPRDLDDEDDDDGVGDDDGSDGDDDDGDDDDGDDDGDD